MLAGESGDRGRTHKCMGGENGDRELKGGGLITTASDGPAGNIEDKRAAGRAGDIEDMRAGGRVGDIEDMRAAVQSSRLSRGAAARRRHDHDDAAIISPTSSGAYKCPR